MQTFKLKHLFTGILLVISGFATAFAGNIITPQERAVTAEKIWMEKGIDVIIARVGSELKASAVQQENFRRLYSETITNDKLFFFHTAVAAEQFITEGENGNYSDWLNERTGFYRNTLKDYMLKPESRVSRSAISRTMATPPCYSGGAGCGNIGFESGTTSGWETWNGTACSDATFGDDGCHAYGSSSSQVSIMTGSGYDAIAGGTNLPVVCPGGSYSLMLGDLLNGSKMGRIERYMKVSASTPLFLYKYAVVLEDPGTTHPDEAKPFFRVKVFEINQSTCNPSSEIECASYVVVANPEDEELEESFIRVSPSSPYYFKRWTTIAIPLQDYVDKVVKIEFTVSDCAWGGHLGYAYIDGECLSNGSLSSGSCVGTTGERSITAPDGFNSYWWSGPGITSSNAIKTITVNRPGTYNLLGETRTGCFQDYSVTVDSCARTAPAVCNISSITATPGSCNIANNYYQVTGTVTFTNAPASGVLVITNGSLSQLYYPPFSSPLNYTIPNLISDGVLHTVTAAFYTGKFFSNFNTSCSKSVNYTAPAQCFTATLPCSTCLTSFNPEPGKYIISAWVKEIGANPDVETYSNAYIQLKFSNGTTVLSKMYGSGKIIEGWQRIFYEFTIPGGATNIDIDLGTNAGSALFDDIRVHPANGSFVSYVYDPVSLKLVATLDDNNYATIYEYDQEGTLLRVKKETERGIMTIKESRESSPKR